MERIATSGELLPSKQIASRKELFQFFNAITLACIISFTVINVALQEYHVFFYNLLPTILLILNLRLVAKSTSYKITISIFFLVYNLIAVFSVLSGAGDGPFFLVISLGLLISALILPTVFFALQFLFFQTVQVYVLFMTDAFAFPPDIIPVYFVKLLSVQLVIVSYGIFMNRRYVKYTFGLLERLRDSQNEIIKIPEFLESIKEHYTGANIELIIHDDNLHVANPEAIAHCFKELGSRIAELQCNKIIINCYKEYVLITFSTSDAEKKLQQLLNSDTKYNMMTEQLFPSNHHLQKLLRMNFLELSFSVFPDSLCLKIAAVDSFNIETELLRFSYIQGESVSNDNPSDDVPESSWHSKFALGKRELEVIDKILQGKSYKQTAWELGLSINTIKTYIYRVYKKCNVKSAMELNSLVSDSDPEKNEPGT